MRIKGQKSSRAATLDALYQSLRELEGGVLEPQKKEDEEITDVHLEEEAEEVPTVTTLDNGRVQLRIPL